MVQVLIPIERNDLKNMAILKKGIGIKSKKVCKKLGII